MNQTSREALARGREIARRPPRDGNGNFIPIGSKGRIRGISARIRGFIRALNENPDVLELALVGGLLASLKDAADWERQAFADVRARRKSVKPEDDPDGSERIKIHLEVLPIIDEARKGRKLAQDLLARAAEIKARALGGGRGYLEDRYGDGAPGGHADDQVPPDAADAEVLDDEGKDPGKGSHGATSADVASPPDGASDRQ